MKAKLKRWMPYVALVAYGVLPLVLFGLKFRWWLPWTPITGFPLPFPIPLPS